MGKKYQIVIVLYTKNFVKVTQEARLKLQDKNQAMIAIAIKYL